MRSTLVTAHVNQLFPARERNTLQQTHGVGTTTTVPKGLSSQPAAGQVCRP